MKIASFALAAGLIALPALAQETVASDPAAPASASAALKDAKGADAGTASLSDAGRGVLVKLNLKGLAPGWHAVHFHEKGDCSDPKFTSAGGHVHSAEPVVHGLLNAKANDAGDLPNIHVPEGGVVQAEVFSTWVGLTAGQRLNLKDADGSAIVVHAKPDDHQSQPIGGAGDRVACGVIK
ncbi:MAG TPA: superoxide dismutase family protein [Phenylobacterium sp.]|nr:superoxide dismutase family protein [Phenylobacterium sp.]